MPRFNLAPFALVLALLLAACGGQAPPPAATQAPKQPPPSGANAAKLYADTCASCHGPNRQGIPSLGPSLTPERLASIPDATLKDTISNGRPNTAMLPFKTVLKEADVDALVQFIKTTPP